MERAARNLGRSVLVAGLLAVGAAAAIGAESESKASTSSGRIGQSDRAGKIAAEERSTEQPDPAVKVTEADRVFSVKKKFDGKGSEVQFKTVGSDGASDRGKELAWLGVASGEVSEALSAQLGLDAGVGLLVTHVSEDSPAAKAGLRKHDVLVEFEGQWLVHPEQLRKLVQVRKEGDTVKLVYYRAGKKQSVSATLAKRTADLRWLGDEQSWQGSLDEFRRQFRDLRVEEFVRDQAKNLGELLGQLKVDKDDVQKDVRRSMEEARKALEEALRRLGNSRKTSGPAAKVLEDLTRGDVEVSKNATVTVRSSQTETKTGHQNVQVVVKTDDDGTYLITADPKKRLTAHDKDGELLFDGAIETSDQQAEVPKEVWKKVKPMIDQMGKQENEKSRTGRDDGI